MSRTKSNTRYNGKTPPKISLLLEKARTKGHTPRSLDVVSKDIDEFYCKLPTLLLDLKDALSKENSRKVKKCLSKSSNILFGSGSTVTPHGLSSAPLKSFLALGGLDIILKILFIDDDWILKPNSSSPSPAAFQIWNLCIKIATEFVMVDPTLSWYMFSREKRIVRRALKLLCFRSTFDNAAVMCEQLLASIGPCVDLATVCPDFSSLVDKMNDMQLALLCRVLALLVNPAWNVQVHDNSHKFARLINRLKNVESLMQRNHDLVIDHPGILKRLVGLLNYQVQHMRSMQYGGSFALLLPVTAPAQNSSHHMANESHENSELEAEWAQPTNPTMVPGGINEHGINEMNYYPEPRENPATDIVDDQMDNPNSQSGWFYPPTPQSNDERVDESLNQNYDPEEEMKSFDKLAKYSHQSDQTFSSTLDDVLFGGVFGEEARSLSIVSCQSEVLFILSSLLSGRRSTEVWQRLSEDDILGVIYKTFDSIFDRELDPREVDANANPHNNDPSSHQNHRHDPETLRKMEYLRLIHEFWDCRDVYELHNIERSKQRDCRRRLAQKLIDRLIKQNEDPCTYNVLTYALEAFIRGTPFSLRLSEQVFLSSHVLNHLVDVISECRNEHRIESEFSLLAELLKFNQNTMYQLEMILSANENKYKGLLSVVTGRPFHSNLFLRSLILTLPSYQTDDTPEDKQLLISQLSCCLKCREKSAHNHEYWEPYSVFVERIQKAKETVDIQTSSEYGRDIKEEQITTLLNSLQPSHMDKSTCTICFENVLLPEQLCAQDVDSDYIVNENARNIPPTLSKFINSNKIKMIRNLMVEISLKQVCRENMCCVTTTLVFFVNAMHASNIESLLNSIRDYELSLALETCSKSESVSDLYKPNAENKYGRMDPFRNFFELVCVWLAYYADQRHYQDTLFYCTHIPMSAWRSTVKTLISLLPQYYLN